MLQRGSKVGGFPGAVSFPQFGPAFQEASERFRASEPCFCLADFRNTQRMDCGVQDGLQRGPSWIRISGASFTLLCEGRNLSKASEG